MTWPRTNTAPWTMRLVPYWKLMWDKAALSAKVKAKWLVFTLIFFPYYVFVQLSHSTHCAWGANSAHQQQHTLCMYTDVLSIPHSVMLGVGTHLGWSKTHSNGGAELRTLDLILKSWLQLWQRAHDGEGFISGHSSNEHRPPPKNNIAVVEATCLSTLWVTKGHVNQSHLSGREIDYLLHMHSCYCVMSIWGCKLVVMQRGIVLMFNSSLQLKPEAGICQSNEHKDLFASFRVIWPDLYFSHVS